MKWYTGFGHALNRFHSDILGQKEFVNACVVGFQFVKLIFIRKILLLKVENTPF